MTTYTAEERAFLESYIPGHHHRQTAEEFSRRFWHITDTQVKSYASNHRIHTGFNGSEGMSSWNSGKKYEAGGRSVETRFKPGQMPHNGRPVGSERPDRDGYTMVKIADPNVWREKHRVIWEKANRPLRKGEIVIFLDGNRKNFDLSNLRCITRRIHSVINHMHLAYFDNQTFEAACMVAELHLAIADARRKRNKKVRPEQ